LCASASWGSMSASSCDASKVRRLADPAKLNLQ
jgi:hypothetical protein